MHQTLKTTLNYFIKSPMTLRPFLNCEAALMAYWANHLQISINRLVFQTYAVGEGAGELLCFIIQAIHNIIINRCFCNQIIPSEVLLSLKLPARSPRHGAAVSELDALELSLLTSLAQIYHQIRPRNAATIIWSDFEEEVADIYPHPNLRLVDEGRERCQ